MNKINANQVVTTLSQQSTGALTKSARPSGGKLREARQALAILLKGRLETDRENPKYLAEMVEVLSHLTDEELSWLTDPREGLQTVCKFLPNPADVHGFIREKRAKADQFRPAATSWHRIGDDDPAAPWNRETDYERKRRVVVEALGYDPARSQAPVKRNLVPPVAADVEALTIRTPPAPPSGYLIDLLRRDGWPYLPLTWDFAE